MPMCEQGLRDALINIFREAQDDRPGALDRIGMLAYVALYPADKLTAADRAWADRVIANLPG